MSEDKHQADNERRSAREGLRDLGRKPRLAIGEGEPDAEELAEAKKAFKNLNGSVSAILKHTRDAAAAARGLFPDRPPSLFEVRPVRFWCKNTLG